MQKNDSFSFSPHNPKKPVGGGLLVTTAHGFGNTTGLHWRAGGKTAGQLTPYKEGAPPPFRDAVLYDIQKNNETGKLTFTPVKPVPPAGTKVMGFAGGQSVTQFADGRGGFKPAPDALVALGSDRYRDKAGDVWMNDGRGGFKPAVPPAGTKVMGFAGGQSVTQFADGRGGFKPAVPPAGTKVMGFAGGQSVTQFADGRGGFKPAPDALVALGSDRYRDKAGDVWMNDGRGGFKPAVPPAGTKVMGFAGGQSVTQFADGRGGFKPAVPPAGTKVMGFAGGQSVTQFADGRGGFKPAPDALVALGSDRYRDKAGDVWMNDGRGGFKPAVPPAGTKVMGFAGGQSVTQFADGRGGFKPAPDALVALGSDRYRDKAGDVWMNDGRGGFKPAVPPAGTKVMGFAGGQSVTQFADGRGGFKPAPDALVALGSDRYRDKAGDVWMNDGRGGFKPAVPPAGTKVMLGLAQN